MYTDRTKSHDTTIALLQTHACTTKFSLSVSLSLVLITQEPFLEATLTP